jgi:hypothetical protein
MMMKNIIGGNLVRWNTTYFGMNYLFLESFLKRKDGFMQWMTTPQLQQSGYLDSNAEKYAHAWWQIFDYSDTRTSENMHMYNPNLHSSILKSTTA